jgi:hypothetical protein
VLRLHRCPTLMIIPSIDLRTKFGVGESECIDTRIIFRVFGNTEGSAL